MSDAFLDARITALETLIVAYETSILEVVGGASSYTFDTGQSKQTVTRANLTETRNAYAAALNLRDILIGRRDGGNVYGTPAF